MSEQALLAAALFLPAAGAALVALCHRWPNLREAVSLVTAALTFLAVVSLAEPVMAGARPALVLAQMLPGLAIALELEPLGLLFALIASGLWFVSGVYSIGYMRGNDEAHQTRFYVCFALAISGAIGVAFAGNLLTLYLFYEALTLVTWPLVTHHGTPEAMSVPRVRQVRATVDLVAIATDIVEEYRLHAQEKALNLTLETPREALPRVETDPRLVQVILRNLLSNAVKFTHRGYVKITIAKLRSAETEVLQFAIAAVHPAIPEVAGWLLVIGSWDEGSSRTV